MDKVKERIDYLDIAKGIAIICIILGHMSLKHVNVIVFTFHVPIFFIISGYFSYKKYDYKTLFKKLFKTLIVPYIVTCILIIVCTIAKRVISGGVNSGFISEIYNLILASLYGSGLTSYYLHIMPIGAIWFLLALFWSKLMFNYLIDKKYKYIFIILIFILGIVSKKVIWLPFSIQPGMTCLLFLYIGYLSRRLDLFNIFKIKHLLVFLATTVLVILVNYKMYGWTVMGLVSNHFTCIPLNIVGALSGSFLVITISKYISKIKSLKNILILFGKYSLIVLCFHLFEMKVIPFLKITSLFINNYYLKYCVLSVIKIVWAVICIFSVRKIPFMRKIFCLKS